MDDASSSSLAVVENLDVARAPQPTLDGVYFIAPSERSVARVVEDCEKKLYRKAHVFFTSAAPRGVLNAIKASKACVSMLGNCSEMNLEYFTVDPKGFSVGVEDALRGTFAVGSEQSQAQARMMDMIAQRLATVMVSLGEIPSIRYMAKVGNKKSDVSRGVADRLDRSLTALLRAKGAEAAKSNPTCDVLIVDRSFDVNKIDNSTNNIICSNKLFRKQLSVSSKKLGYKPIVIDEDFIGEAKFEAISLINKLIEISSKYPTEKLAIISGGETVVDMKGSGKGGRNQELALSFLANVDKVPSSLDWLLLSIGTDGIDGPTDAAGGIIDNASILALSKSNLDIHEYLDNNDSYTFLDSIASLYKTGPSGTNVADIQIILVNR